MIYPYDSVPKESPFDLVRDWMLKFERPIDQEPNWKDMDLCWALIDEEHQEVEEELMLWRGDDQPTNYMRKEELTKELCDLIWVCIFCGVKFGLPLEAAFKRVYDSNMSKLQDDGTPLLREDGKILKGPNYQPVDLKDLF